MLFYPYEFYYYKRFMTTFPAASSEVFYISYHLWLLQHLVLLVIQIYQPLTFKIKSKLGGYHPFYCHHTFYTYYISLFDENFY